MTSPDDVTRDAPRPVTAEAVRELDRRAIDDYGVPGVVLMENAGRGAAQLARELLGDATGHVVILAGRGNNGGDGYVVARHLANAGIRTQTFVLASLADVSGDARVNLNIILNMGLPVTSVDLERDEDRQRVTDAFADASLIVDAILGTGARGELRGAFRRAVELINASAKPVLALDIPTGLHADTGEVLGVAVKARATATFLCPKLGLTRQDGPEHTGRVVVVNIGVPGDLPPLSRQGRSE